ncbi:MAG: TetR/AcrR family transcriptional regulator [Gammaproteobacteria bacterium]|nr:TetR/AcrR family transcriptional regulator [Gammaproteobacteria bacterium]
MAATAASKVSSGQRRTQAERSALAELRMTEAAIELLNERGIGGATLKAIGEKAGYSRGLATHHFGSKSGLFRLVLKRVSAIWVAQLDKHVGSRTGLEALRMGLTAHYRFVRGFPRHVFAMQVLNLSSLDPGSEFKPNVAEFLQGQRKVAVRWVEEGQAEGTIRANIDPVRFAEQYLGSIIGILNQWQMSSGLSLKKMYQEYESYLCVLVKP